MGRRPSSGVYVLLWLSTMLAERSVGVCEWVCLFGLHESRGVGGGGGGPMILISRLHFVFYLGSSSGGRAPY